MAATSSGIGAVEDLGDRGDSYDFDPLAERATCVERVDVRRFRHPSGIEELELTRSLRIPARLEQDREHHSSDTRLLRLVVVARVVPGIERVDLRVRLENAAEDHRLRLLFPTQRPTTKVVAASTFDVMTRSLAKPDASKWVHPAPTASLTRAGSR